MTNPTITTLLDDLVFPEGPRWRDGRLWFSDMHAQEVVAVTPGGEREVVARVPNNPSGLGWLPDGRMLIVSMDDRRLLRREADGSLVEHADLSALATGRCNDMIVDAAGRAYVGHFGFDLHKKARFAEASLIAVAPDGGATVAASPLRFPNGAVITEGCIWVAVPRPGGFLRVAEGGDVRERVDLEGWGGYACMLGGEEGRTLFLLEALTATPEEMSGRGNGRIRTMEVDAPRAGLP